MPQPQAQAHLAALRDELAGSFAEQIARHVPQALEMLEQQIAGASRHEEWKPLRQAIDLLGGLRATLARRVAQEVAERFDAKLKPEDSTFGKTARFSLDSLSLVGDDQVREEIAIGNAAKRLRDQLGEELFALTQRLASLMGVEVLSDDRNPAFPRIFTRGLYDALAEPGADTGARIAAFSAFGPATLEVIRDVYQGANKMLVGRGVLPDFKRAYGAPTQLPSRAAPSAPSAGPMAPGYAGSGYGSMAPGGPGVPPPRPSGLGGSDVQAPAPLERLFAALHDRGRPVEAAPSDSPATGGLVTVQVRPDLLEALRTLETRRTAVEALAGPGPEADEPGTYVHSAEIRRAKRAMGASLSPTDAVVADVVAAMFERLMADRRLPDAIKAQVGRMQLPVFKAVMKDHSFFNDPRHPIRRLIDLMAELGSADPNLRIEDCTPEEWVAVAVQNVVDGPDDDPGVFTRERDALAAILERQHEAALEGDAEVATLRERERGLVAMREATLTIAHRVAATTASNDAAGFLYRRWREVMVHDYLEGGDAGPGWKADLEILDDIFWVLVPRTSVDDRLRLVSLLPSLLQRMRLAYARVGVEARDAAQRVEEMRVLLDEVMRSPASAVQRMRRATAPEPLPDDYTATLHVSGAVREEGLVRGAWVEFREPGGEARRCRLTWVSPVQGACVFKDMERNRSFPIGLEELRERRRAGTAALVDGPGVAAASVDAALADVAQSLEADGRIMPRGAN